MFLQLISLFNMKGICKKQYAVTLVDKALCGGISLFNLRTLWFVINCSVWSDCLSIWFVSGRFY